MTTTTAPIATDDPPINPYVLDPAAIENPPTSLGRALRQVGPGLILAGAIVGTGELIATTNLGAKVGFVLLWLVIVSCFIKVFVQVELGRYTISSGDTTFAAFGKLPGPGIAIGWWWVVMMLVTQLQLGAMVGGVGHAMHMAMPFVAEALGATARPEVPWAILVTIVTSVMLAIGGYRFIERTMTTMVAIFTLMTVVCVVLLPAAGHSIDWAAVGNGLTFQIPPEAVAAAIAMFGITGVGATELVSYPYWCIEKGYASKTGPRDDSVAWVQRAKGWLRVMRLDCWVSMIVYTIATLAFFGLGAAVLHNPAQAGRGLPDSVGAMLDRLAEMYQPVMGVTGALVFIVIGAIAVLYSTLFSATASNCRALADFFHVSRMTTFRTHADRTRLVMWCCILFPVIDLVLYLFIGNPVQMVIIGGFAQAITLPMVAAAAVYLRYKRTAPELRPGRLWDVFLWLSLLGLMVVAVYGLWDNLKKVM